MMMGRQAFSCIASSPAKRQKGTDYSSCACCICASVSGFFPRPQATTASSSVRSRLLGDAMAGISDLFTRQDIVDAQWRIVEDILDNVTPVYSYNPDTWGPSEAEQLFGANGRWLNPSPK